MDVRPLSLLPLLDRRQVGTDTADDLDRRIGSSLNGPYFDTSARDRQVERLVISVWREFDSLPRFGPFPKQFVDRLLRLADRWWVLSWSDHPNTAEAALLRYNASMVVVEVIRAVNGDER